MTATINSEQAHNTRIKICGLKDVETIFAMNELSITEVGLVFAESKRQVTIEQGKQLVEAIHSLNNGQVKAAGVFVRKPLEHMEQLLEQVPLNIVQLHGNEETSYYAQLNHRFPQIELWKVISVQPTLDMSNFDEAFIQDELESFVPYIHAILIDAPGGGTGQPFNWKAIDLYRKLADHYRLPLYVAGGLHADNVGELIESYNIDGVDVSSGVETNGQKDVTKIHEFVRRVRKA